MIQLDLHKTHQLPHTANNEHANRGFYFSLHKMHETNLWKCRSIVRATESEHDNARSNPRTL